jgi:hypothetical protein
MNKDSNNLQYTHQILSPVSVFHLFVDIPKLADRWGNVAERSIR